MKIRTMGYMIKQGFKGLWRNSMMSMASIGSVASALIILGIVFMMVLNINNLVETAKEQFDSIQIYLKDEADDTQAKNIEAALKNIEGVGIVEYRSREQALKDMKEQWGDQGYLLEGLESNPLPNSFVVQIKDIVYADGVVKKVRGLDGIEEVKYYKDIVDKLLNITRLIRVTGIVLIVILTTIAMFIISNTIKITVSARYREINIMKYVGATNWFIRWPFLIEGMVLGLIGSMIALGVVGYSYMQIYNLITQKLYIMISIYMIPAPIIVHDLSVIFIVLGTGIGALGSIFSMRRFLKV